MDGFCKDKDSGSQDREYTESHAISGGGYSGEERDGVGSGRPFGSDGSEKGDRILFVRNCHRRFVDDRRLLEIFSSCGPVESAKVSNYFFSLQNLFVMNCFVLSR